MLKYSKENYSSWKDFQLKTVEELKTLLVGHDAEHDGFEVSIDDFKLDYVYFGTEGKDVIKVFLGDDEFLLFFGAVNTGTLKLNNEDMCAYEEINSIYTEAEAIHKVELEEEAKLAEIRLTEIRAANIKRAEEKAAKLAKIEEERKFKLRIEKNLKKLAMLSPEKTSRLFETPTNYYEALGWMAKHTASIKSSMPDYMEPWFVKRFGDVERNVVNSKKRTQGGHPKQWGLSFKMSFNAEVSGPLEQRATSKNKKVIDSVAFVWDLIEHYGFQFVKGAQDIEKIKEEIPQEHISDFEKGLEM